MNNKLWAKPVFMIVALLMVLGVSSCKKNYDAIEVEDDKKILDYLAANKLTMQKDPSGFYYQILSPGTAVKPKNTDSVFYGYDIKSIDGTVFKSAMRYSYTETLLGYVNLNPSLYRANDPLRTAMSNLIGFGGKIRMIIPSYLAFDRNGIPTGSVIIPGNEIIDTQLELRPERTQMDVDQHVIQVFMTDNNITNMTKDPSGVWYNISVPGSGGDPINPVTTQISVNYVGRFMNGVVFDQSVAGTPSKFIMNSILQGWGKVVPKLQKGGKLRMVIPSVLAYGKSGSGAIGPNLCLDFDVELVDVSNNY